MPVFTSKYFPSTGKKYSRRYRKHFVWLARDHTMYPGSWRKWKLLLNKITSGDVNKQNSKRENFHCHWQQNLVWLQSWVRVSHQYMIDCFSHISTKERARHYSETRSRSNISGAYTCWKTLIKPNFFNGKTVLVDWGLVPEYFFVAGTTYQ